MQDDFQLKATCCKSAASGQTFLEEPRKFFNKNKLFINSGRRSDLRILIDIDQYSYGQNDE